MANSHKKPPAAPGEESPKGLRIFGNKPFMRFAESFGVSGTDLWEMCNRAPEADLGGGVYKFRLAREGQGKSGGARSIVALKKDDRAIMMYGFEKKDIANIDVKELKTFKKLAKQYFDRSTDEMDQLVKLGILFEISPPEKAK